MVPITVREQITNQLREELVSGRFEAGSMLREIELAGRFGVSRGPVRDAFIKLSHEGFLAYYANRGVMVRHPPKPEDREFVTSIRRQMESHVVSKGIANLTDKNLAIVEAALARLKEDCDGGKAPSIALGDVEFHQAIMVACDGEEFVGAWRQLCSRMLLTYTRHDNYDETYQEHVDIFEALSRRSAQDTIAAINANIK